MPGGRSHELTDYQTRAADGTIVLRCECGWQSAPLPDPDRDEEWSDRARDVAWQEHFGPLVTPDPSHVLIRGQDHGGLRYFLGGRPVHAGSGVELLMPDGSWWPGRVEFTTDPEGLRRRITQLGLEEDERGLVAVPDDVREEFTRPVFHGLLGGPWCDNNAMDYAPEVRVELVASAVLRWPESRERDRKSVV